MSTFENAAPLDDWRVPVQRCCGLILPTDALTCPSCGEYVNPAIRHIDLSA